ncbi:hypothetical protein FOTG_10183 [Fusarium oxysporum f. sp. vasinfectum 25433]|uniref:GH18 domain-containing protein n=1 Tax=Fusarium oxysporum f. sp. vasinfectum 25433 TaxID=1089449 RepID=X0MMV9_FUSOX|nr:hypothetical protein FOTG_10183 [Fusarium oxysporum f. sp. vasinfectum 25433]
MFLSRRLVAVGLLCASVVKGLDLDTFTGQAQVLGRQREMILNQQQGDDTVKPMRMMAEPEADDSDGKCTKKKGCKLGCCGPLDKEGFGICGTGPEFCGKDCTSECDYKSECDPGGWGLKYSNFTTCPLSVCCSDYGFCGTLSSYCKGKTVASPKCDKAKHSSDKRTIGYYEGWNYQRPCGNMEPEDIHSSWKDLEVWIAIGGWAMNDPGKYRTVFSDLAKSEKKQDDFFDSLITFLQRYDFDGVDLDWEYPVAENRGGIEEDFENYVNLLARLRNVVMMRSHAGCTCMEEFSC